MSVVKQTNLTAANTAYMQYHIKLCIMFYIYITSVRHTDTHRHIINLIILINLIIF